MSTRPSLRALSAALVLAAAPASAQIVNYSTTGSFTPGTFGTTTCTSTQCTVDGFTLTFQGNASANYLAPTFNADLGQFVTSYTPGTATNVSALAFTGVSFTLMINQTNPTVGSAPISDGITGTLAYNPSASTLFWSPGATLVTIGQTTYALVTDQQFPGKIGISPPVANDGGNPNATTIRANITTTPEPATALLLAPGLVGIGLAVRRNRRGPGTSGPQA